MYAAGEVERHAHSAMHCMQAALRCGALDDKTSEMSRKIRGRRRGERREERERGERERRERREFPDLCVPCDKLGGKRPAINSTATPPQEVGGYQMRICERAAAAASLLCV